MNDQRANVNLVGTAIILVAVLIFLLFGVLLTFSFGQSAQPMAVPRPSNIIPQLTLLFFLSIIIGSGVLTAKRNPQKGIAGWLLLPAINLIVSPILLAVMIIVSYNKLPELSQANTLIVQFGIFKNTLILIFTLYVAKLFFQKTSKAPKMYIVLLLINVVLSIIALFQGGEVYIGTFFSSLILSSIWIPYFLKSSRVKATFIDSE